MENLDKLIVRAEQIVEDKKRSQQQKDAELAAIMTEMEGKYRIPLLNDLEWNATHPDVIRTYRQISDMRSL